MTSKQDEEMKIQNWIRTGKNSKYEDRRGHNVGREELNELNFNAKIYRGTKPKYLGVAILKKRITEGNIC